MYLGALGKILELDLIFLIFKYLLNNIYFNNIIIIIIQVLLFHDF